MDIGAVTHEVMHSPDRARHHRDAQCEAFQGGDREPFVLRGEDQRIELAHEARWRRLEAMQHDLAGLQARARGGGERWQQRAVTDHMQAPAVRRSRAGQDERIEQLQQQQRPLDLDESPDESDVAHGRVEHWRACRCLRGLCANQCGVDAIDDGHQAGVAEACSQPRRELVGHRHHRALQHARAQGVGRAREAAADSKTAWQVFRHAMHRADRRDTEGARRERAEDVLLRAMGVNDVGLPVAHLAVQPVQQGHGRQQLLVEAVAMQACGEGAHPQLAVVEHHEPRLHIVAFGERACEREHLRFRTRPEVTRGDDHHAQRLAHAVLGDGKWSSEAYCICGSGVRLLGHAARVKLPAMLTLQASPRL